MAELSIDKGTRFNLSELGANFKAVFHRVEVVLDNLLYFRSDPVGINYANQSDVHAKNYLPLFNLTLSALSRSMSTDDLLNVFALQLHQILNVEQLPVLFALHFLEDLQMRRLENGVAKFDCLYRVVLDQEKGLAQNFSLKVLQL